MSNFEKDNLLDITSLIDEAKSLHRKQSLNDDCSLHKNNIKLRDKNKCKASKKDGFTSKEFQ